MIRLFTDGASRGNPGKAAIGAIAYEDGDKLFEISENLGEQTNNYAEYMALIRALETLIEMRKEKERLLIYADSNLLVEQVSGRWKVKNKNILPLFTKARELLTKFDKYEIEHIYRENNKEADALANKALDSI